ncbi:variable large family protein [Borrelia crocidurae]|nr:variable large family protein [Borrelia crocidurae]
MKKREVKGIRIREVMMMMVMVVMVMGCNSGGVSGEGTGGGDGRGAKSLSEVLLEVGRGAENVFYSFLELVSGSLGFAVKATTKKNEVGDYFDGLGKKLEIVSGELEKVAEKASADVDKEGILNKGIRAAVDMAKTTLNTLKVNLELLGQVGDDKVVGWVENDQQGIKPVEDGLNKALNSLQAIVKSATDVGVSVPEVGNTTLTVNGVDNKDGAKVLAIDKPGAAVGEKAGLIVAAVSGEEILASIIESGKDDAALTQAAKSETTAMNFAKGGSKDHLANDATPKAAAVSGGIALRSLVKNGKLAAHSGGNDSKAVQSAGVISVNKLLGAVEDIIKKTFKKVLEKAKGEIDKARGSKEPVSESSK